MPQSTLCLRPLDSGKELRFSGVTQLRHGFTAKVNVDGESGAADVVNGARNQPNKLTLSVLASPVGHPAGWPRRLLECLERLKRNRTLVSVETSVFLYPRMLLSDLTVIQDDQSGDGWTGTLILTEYAASGSSAASSGTSSGSASAASRSGGGSSGSMLPFSGQIFSTPGAKVTLDHKIAQPTAEELRAYCLAQL